MSFYGPVFSAHTLPHISMLYPHISVFLVLVSLAAQSLNVTNSYVLRGNQNKSKIKFVFTLKCPMLIVSAEIRSLQKEFSNTMAFEQLPNHLKKKYVLTFTTHNLKNYLNMDHRYRLYKFIKHRKREQNFAALEVTKDILDMTHTKIIHERNTLQFWSSLHTAKKNKT